MLPLFAYFLTTAALVLSVPVVVLAIEVVAAIILRERPEPGNNATGVRPRIAIMIPAHDEGAGLLPSVSDAQGQLRPGDRLLIIADNCSDDTAKVARSAGAEVIERHDPGKVGKGYALDWGLRHLQTDPPEIVIVVDADCRLKECTIDRLTRSCQATGRPTQALYRMMNALKGDEPGSTALLTLPGW